MSDLSINLSTPLWQGERFVRTLTDDVNDWSHTNRAVGG